MTAAPIKRGKSPGKDSRIRVRIRDKWLPANVLSVIDHGWWRELVLTYSVALGNSRQVVRALLDAASPDLKACTGKHAFDLKAARGSVERPDASPPPDSAAG